jgi:hypothetical protein
MNRMIIQYRVKAGRAEENEAAVRRVFDELRREAPPGLRYATFKLEDELTFVHLVSVETADERSPLQSLESFKSFTANVRDRCDEMPINRRLFEVGSYRLF